MVVVDAVFYDLYLTLREVLHQVDGLCVCVKDIMFVLNLFSFDIEYIFFTTFAVSNIIYN